MKNVGGVLFHGDLPSADRHEPEVRIHSNDIIDFDILKFQIITKNWILVKILLIRKYQFSCLLRKSSMVEK